MGLGVALLQQREPGFLGVLALGKVEGAAVGVVDAAVGLLLVQVLEMGEGDAVEAVLAVVWFGEI